MGILNKGTKVRLNDRVAGLPKGAVGIINKFSLGFYSVAFEDTEVDLSENEFDVVDYTRGKDSYSLPNKKRIVAPNTYADRIVSLRMADTLEKELQNNGFDFVDLKLLRTTRNNHTQAVESAVFEFTFSDEDGYYKKATAAMYADIDNSRIILPTVFRYSGKTYPMTTESAMELSESRMYEKQEYDFEPRQQQYVKSDPARYMTYAKQMEHGFIKEGQMDMKLRLYESLKEGGYEFSFDPKKYRDTDTGVPIHGEQESEKEPFQTDPDSVKDYSTMDGRDEEHDKEDRLEMDTFVPTTAGLSMRDKTAAFGDIKIYKPNTGTGSFLVVIDGSVFEMNDNTSPQGVNTYVGEVQEYNLDMLAEIPIEQAPEGLVQNIKSRVNTDYGY